MTPAIIVATNAKIAVRLTQYEHDTTAPAYGQEWRKTEVFWLERVGNKGVMVPEVGVEPTRGCPHWILNPARLPVSSPGQVEDNLTPYREIYVICHLTEIEYTTAMITLIYVNTEFFQLLS